MATTYYVSNIEGTTLNIREAAYHFASYISSLSGISSGFTEEESRRDYLVGPAHIAYRSRHIQATPIGSVGTIAINITSFSPIDDLETQILKAFKGKSDIATIALVQKEGS